MQLELLPGCEYPQAIGALFAEYTDMLVREDPAFASYLELQHYDQEVAHLEQKYGPPGGTLYLARADGQDAGCIGLRRMDALRCEMKRLYVRPAFRGCGIAHTLVETILADARALGYRQMFLDTLPFLDTAIAMYHRFGFIDIPRYNDSPLDNTVYLRLDL